MKKQKFLAIICVLALLLCVTACGGEEESTTVSGMVVSVEGTVITLREMSGQMNGNFGGNRPNQRETGGIPEGFDPKNMPENFDPENMPENFDPENLPEGFDPENMPGQRPNGEGRTERPTGEDTERSTDESRPNFKQFGNGEGVKTKTYDLASAHISVEIDEGKASGSMDDIKQGSFVTITLNGKGEATYVLVSSRQGFGNRGQGMSRPDGQNGANGKTERETQEPSDNQNNA